MSTIVTADEITSKRISILNNIFDVLEETTGIRSALDSDNQSPDACREDFLQAQLHNRAFYASEYCFTSSSATNMKIVFSTWDGFVVLSQSRAVGDVTDVEKANARLVEMGYHS